FAIPWTDAIGTPGFRSAVIEYHRGLRDAWRPDAWSLLLGVYVAGSVIGAQEVSAVDFAARRVVSSGSWLGLAYQGRGYGTQMWAAMLHLAFAGLGAHAALSGAFETNPASARVSAKLGYRPEGEAIASPRGVPVVERRFVLDRAAWEASDRIPVELRGVAPCRALFGA